MKTFLIWLLSGLLLAVMLRLIDPADGRKAKSSDKKPANAPEPPPGKFRKFLGVAIDAAITKVIEDVIDLIKKAITDKMSLLLVGAISTGVYFSALTLEQVILIAIFLCLFGILWIAFLVYGILQEFKQQQAV